VSHNFDEAIAVELSGPDAFTSQTHPAYANMVGPFGGVTAGAVVRALHQHERSLGEPAALTINYVAPIADGAWQLVVEEVRTNRSNQHWLFRIIQDEQVVTTGSMVFAAVRDTWGATELAPPPVGPPEEVPAAEPIIPLAWLSRYEMRFVAGIPPVKPGPGAADSTTTLWIRDSPPRPLDFASLTAMADCFFPRVFLRTGAFAPAGTISLSVYFHATTDELAAVGEDYLLATARGGRFGHGLFDQSGELWSRSGALLATTTQLVYYKDPA